MIWMAVEYKKLRARLDKARRKVKKAEKELQRLYTQKFFSNADEDRANTRCQQYRKHCDFVEQQIARLIMNDSNPKWDAVLIISSPRYLQAICGRGKPLSEGHAHGIVEMNDMPDVIYRRPLDAKHGSQNYVGRRAVKAASG